MHYPILDTIILATTACAAAIVQLLLADASTHQIESIELQVLLLPLLGGMLVSGAMILLNPNPEARRVVIGRAGFALFAALCAPTAMQMLYPPLSVALLQPIFIFGSGGMIAGVGYVLARPVAKKLFERSESVADSVLNNVEGRLSRPSQSTSVNVTIAQPDPPQAPSSKP